LCRFQGDTAEETPINLRMPKPRLQVPGWENEPNLAKKKPRSLTPNAPQKGEGPAAGAQAIDASPVPSGNASINAVE
jgi:hypothetical protein